MRPSVVGAAGCGRGCRQLAGVVSWRSGKEQVTVVIQDVPREAVCFAAGGCRLTVLRY